MAGTPSFAGRIILAMVLMVCFYALAIGIALVLLLLPVAEVLFANRIHPKIAILCVIGGCMILWSILPRWDRFIPPGPRMTEKDQPELFAQIRSVADATGQAMPAEVYAVPEMNAWVANRGGIMGLGSRRVMGLGVPLMQVLSTQQFRGVLAHEFGHYYGGDTKLGPWIFVTRSAILRTVMNLAQNGSSLLKKPFEWYLMLFLWLTQKVSRQQEFTADALAARTVGPQAIASALKTIHSKALAFDIYWQQEYVPILQSGFRAPLAKGFQSFFDSPKIQVALDKSLDEALKSGQSNLYDSHPALKDRLDAIAKETGPRMPDNDPHFIHVLRDLDRLEVQMIEHLANAFNVKVPASISWEEVTEQVWVPHWKETLKSYGGRLEGIQVWQAFEILGAPEHHTKLLSPDVIQHVASASERKQIAMSMVPIAMVLALHRDGWTIEAPVGAEVVATKGGIRIEPFQWMSELRDEKCTLEDLETRCENCGIADLELVPRAQTTSPL
jgi:Zn-dependent protease with chaperone function